MAYADCWSRVAGKGVAGEVPRKMFITPEQFDLRGSSLFWMNELAINQGGTTQTSYMGSGGSAVGELSSSPTR